MLNKKRFDFFLELSAKDDGKLTFSVAGSDDEELKKRIACEACPGFGSCGGMFTYNTMQTFIGVVGMQPLHMVSPPSDDKRRTDTFPDELISYLDAMVKNDVKK